MSKPSFDVLIIGGGVVGLSIMRELLSYTMTVGLLEKHDDVCSGVSKANSGIIHAGFDDNPGSLRARFAPQGSMDFKKLDDELHFGYREIGSLVLARTDSDTKILKALQARGRENGVSGLSILEKSELYRIEPALQENFIAALYAKNSGIVSPYEFGIALAENCVKNGAYIGLDQAVKAIEYKSGVYHVQTETDTFTSKLLINTAGLHADSISRMLGINTPQIHPRKGSYIVFNRGTGSLVNHVLFPIPQETGKGVLVTPTFHGNLMIGPNAIDIDSKEDVSTTEEEIEDLLSKAERIVTNIPYTMAIKTFAGLRPKIAGGDFSLREAQEGFFECSGIASPGLTSAPAIARYVCSHFVALHMKLEKNHTFDPYRAPYSQPQYKRTFLSPKQANEESKIPISESDCMICRCEQIRRSTIIHALDAGLSLRTPEALARRTRAGFGFCQGNFCRTRVETIIHEYHTSKKNSFSPEKDTTFQQNSSRVPASFIRKQNR